MRKIIITIKNKKITDEQAIEYIRSVIKSGRISKHSKGDHYCWVSVWNNGDKVVTRTKRAKDSPDSFIIL